jgi:glucosamine--fructose-6-phosphate aminotransferase (isomerizing)
MCGIVGILFKHAEVQNFNILLSCLRELQNRGYDSIGISILDEVHHQFLIDKKVGTTACDFFSRGSHRNLLGHTRWATHGGVTVANAHPHLDSIFGEFTLVHNGIIENFKELRDELEKDGIMMKSETDSEVLLNIIVKEYTESPMGPHEERIRSAILRAVERVEGTYGIVVQNLHLPETLFCIRKGSPLIIGTDQEQNTLIITSEKQAFPSFITRYVRLQTDELVVCRFSNKTLIREFISSSSSRSQVIKKGPEEEDLMSSGFQYFTEKEIYDQASLFTRVSKHGSRIRCKDGLVKLGGLDSVQKHLTRCRTVHFLGCGTSYHAALVLQYFFILYGCFDAVHCHDASDFDISYLPRSMDASTCLIFLSQSGETRDLLKLHAEIQNQSDNAPMTLGIINVVDSVLSSLTDAGAYTNVGKERGVASTKAFTAQILTGLLVLFWFIQNSPSCSACSGIGAELWTPMHEIDDRMKIFIPETFKTCREQLLPAIRSFEKMFLLGRHVDFYIAKEGALKIKEIAYRWAEAYSSSALKHGPFALLDTDNLVVFVLSNHEPENVKKVMNSIQEVRARGSTILLLTNDDIASTIDANHGLLHLSIPKHPFAYLFATVALQIIAYVLSIDSGINPDFPRNLAKVVTVE